MVSPEKMVVWSPENTPEWCGRRRRRRSGVVAGEVVGVVWLPKKSPEKCGVGEDGGVVAEEVAGVVWSPEWW